jgi:hypothetical protein
MQVHEIYWPKAGFCDDGISFEMLCQSDHARSLAISVPARAYRQGDLLAIRLWEGVAGLEEQQIAWLQVTRLTSSRIDADGLSLSQLVASACTACPNVGLIHAWPADGSVET